MYKNLKIYCILSADSSSDDDNDGDDNDGNDDDDYDSGHSDSKANMFANQLSARNNSNELKAKDNKPFSNTEIKDEQWGFAAVAKNRPDIFSNHVLCSSLGGVKSPLKVNLAKEMTKNESHTERNKAESKAFVPETTKTNSNSAATNSSTAVSATPQAAAPVVKKMISLKSAPLKDKEKFTKIDDEDVPYLRVEAIQKYQQLENISKATGEIVVKEDAGNNDMLPEHNPVLEPYAFDSTAHKSLLLGKLAI